MAMAARRGAMSITGVETVYRRAADAGVDDMLACAGLLVATSENFGSLAGAIKDFFERVYYPCEHLVAGKPYGVLVCAGTDGTQAMLHTDRIATGLRLRKVHPGLVHKSGITAQPQVVPQPVLDACEEVGATLAAGIAAGIY